jgi:hypothetical protein
MAHSSSGLGRVPLKDEITGSNPVCATTLTFTSYHYYNCQVCECALITYQTVCARVAQWQRNRLVIGRLAGSNPLSG